MGCLVHLDADAMPEPVPEGAGKLARLDQVAGSSIDLACQHAGTSRRYSDLLRRQANLVGAAPLGGDLAAGEGACAVGVVAADRSAGIDHDQIAFLHNSLRRLGVRKSAIRSRGDNRREGVVLGAQLVEELVHAPGQIDLAAPGEGLRGETPVGLAGYLGGAPNSGQLASVFDGAQCFDGPVRRDKRCAARTQLLESRDRHGLGLKRRLSLQQLNQSGEKVAADVNDLDSGHQLRRRGVAGIGAEPRQLWLHQQRRIRAMEARQVTHVGLARDE